jgi:hypothetical protein
MEQIPFWEANSRSAGQEISCYLWKAQGPEPGSYPEEIRMLSGLFSPRRDASSGAGLTRMPSDLLSSFQYIE